VRSRQRDETERAERLRVRSGELMEMEPEPPWIDAGDASSGRFYRWVDFGGA
jgi:hypothetical protein